MYLRKPATEKGAQYFPGHCLAHKNICGDAGFHGQQDRHQNAPVLAAQHQRYSGQRDRCKIRILDVFISVWLCVG